MYGTFSISRKLWRVAGVALVLSAAVLSGCQSSSAQAADGAKSEGTEFCTDQNSGAKMSYEQALEIAQKSECAEQGQLQESHFCNEYTGTWWIDLAVDKPGCSPACVISVVDGSAEINWRCTGLVEPEETVDVPEGAEAAREAALAYLRQSFGEQAPAEGLSWDAESVALGSEEQPLLGASSLRFSAADWEVLITYPIVLPELTIYQVVVRNAASGFEWQGEVDASGQVRELP